MSNTFSKNHAKRLMRALLQNTKHNPHQYTTMDDFLSKAEFITATPEEVHEMQSSVHFYNLSWYPPNTDIKDNEVGIYEGKRVIISD